MDITEKFFLQSVKSQLLNSKITEIEEGVDFRKLYSLCMRHGQSVALYYALNGVKGVDNKFYTNISKQAKSRIITQVRREYERKSLYKLFEENNIKFLVFKGARIRDFYLKPELRFSGDNDIYVECDLNVLKKILSNDYNYLFNDPHHSVFQNKLSGNLYEFHKVLFVGELGKYFINPLEIAKTDNGIKYVMSDNELYITCIAHSAYHFAESGGVGIRAIADVAVFILNGLDVNNKYITDRLKECGLYVFAQKFVKLAEYWFLGGESDEYTLELGKYIMDSDLLGFSEMVSANKLAVRGKGKSHKFKAIMRKIFPKYSDMVYTYPFLGKIKILLPIMYIVRWFAVLFTRPKNVKKITGIKDASDEDIIKAEKLINGLGIKTLI